MFSYPYALHEMEKNDRIPTVQALAQPAGELIIVDYLVPQPKTLTGVLNVIVERAVGQDHFRNFRTFTRADGLVGLLKGAGLTVVDEILGTPAGAHIAVARDEHWGSR
jgi:hypothetical protein